MRPKEVPHAFATDVYASRRYDSAAGTANAADVTLVPNVELPFCCACNILPPFLEVFVFEFLWVFTNGDFLVVFSPKLVVFLFFVLSAELKIHPLPKELVLQMSVTLCRTILLLSFLYLSHATWVSEAS